MADAEQGHGKGAAIVAVLLLAAMIGFATQLDHDKDTAWTYMQNQVEAWMD